MRRAPKVALLVTPGGDRARLLALAPTMPGRPQAPRTPPDPGPLLPTPSPPEPAPPPCPAGVPGHLHPPGGAVRGGADGFIDGAPDKSRYRRFKIREVAGQDDYAMLREV